MPAMNRRRKEMGKYNLHVDDVSIEAVFNRLGGVEGARRLLRGELVLTEAEGEPLLSFVWTFRTTAAEPTIVWTSPQFKDWFGGIAEGARAEELTLRKLARRSRDAAIITALGDKEVAAVSWADFKSALAEKEAEGDHTPIIAYMLDVNGVLRAVSARWSGDGWYVFVCSLNDPIGWSAGNQVLSRPPAEALA
ncbi:hypothetical protein COV42_01280 [Candidatus Campbellbacteria bacterium CG11_big_fil_rev_8_21_14_0_20_44_21]|uniref:Uncharacterized protein n=1 Tax=Candidatus Campbellbacteria bacterium CG22_combo_CG10-13_8_21_14_all_43_18 TaxID=1974530 RepID=A0A2H0DWH5_9BACT|nr:MAG: hypothetical protein COW82_01595 [Candidatus Campbellbacteria bacterium CG22_combo_CG10-13_8_21_14_all_43_18]PIR24349.1 MAG: hypothetical protein COV42_01280 [Candidatus Campbellbacteria bacterium CG11_big_fil_rev_8_21_14_0_20_44_21]